MILGVRDLRFRIQGLGSGIEDVDMRDGAGPADHCERLRKYLNWGLVPEIQGLGFGVWGLGFGMWDVGFGT